MKYIIFFSLILFIAPLRASINCMDNSEHLKKPNDHKELHSIKCYCSCTIIKGGHCTECGHIQNARPLTIIESSRTKQVVKQFTLQSPKNLQDFFNNIPYLQKR